MDFSVTTLYVLPSGTLASDNFKRENLKPTQFGIFNSRYKAVTTAGDALKSPYVVFGQGRIENVPGLTHKYSDKISPSTLIEWYKTTGSPVAKTQITYAGWDTVDSTKTLKAGCDEQYSLTIRGRSHYLDNAYAYGLTQTVTVTTPCCEDCGDDCVTINPIWLANAFSQKINEHELLSKYYIATPVYNCTTPPTAPTTRSVVVYSVSFCDNGDSASLAAVQSQYPNDIVDFKERAGSISTYTLTRLSSGGAPAAVTITQPVRLSVCTTCPASYTLQSSGTQYIVERALLPSDDINSAADKQTYANTIKTAYAAVSTFNGATAVDPTTDAITITGHPYVTGQPVIYSNGGGTSITGLTSGSTYYVIKTDANTIRLASSSANAVAGTPVDITADGVGAAQTFTTQSSAAFLEGTGGTAKVLLTIAGNPGTITPVNSDIVTEVGSTEDYCLPPAGTNYTWAATDTGYQVQRALTLTIANNCGTAGDLSDIQEQFVDYPVSILTTADCVTQYQLLQFSETILDGCEGSIPPAFDSVQEYKGIQWDVVPSNLTGASDDCVAGVKIEGKPLDKYGNACDPTAWSYEFDKLTFQVFSYKGAATSQDYILFDRCDNIPITTVQNSTYVTGSGDEIYELEKRYNSYQTTFKHIFTNVDYNGAFVRYSDGSLFYDTYVLKFKSPDLLTWDASTRQDETVIIAVPTGTGTPIENFLLGYFGPAKFNAGV